MSHTAKDRPLSARLKAMLERCIPHHFVTGILAAVILAPHMQAQAMPRVHDPSTIIRDGDSYYVFSTGRGMPILSSPDGVSWTRDGSVFTQIPETLHSVVPKNNGSDVWAPDIVRVNGQFYLYYAVSSWGSFVSAVGLVTSPTLNPKDPVYHWTDRGVVVRSDGVEDLNAIDPGVILAPDGRLWICYGSYHGTIQLIQLDPKTGLRISPNSPVSIVASSSEASDIIFHKGFYYLFVNHGSCCQGKNSGYNIRVGRSATITGPYLDRHGDPLTKAFGTLFLAAHDHRIGPGHFGRIVEDGAERFSLHYEADLTNDGRSTLGLRPLLWSEDGWPIAGDLLPDGTYQLLSRQSEDALELPLGGSAPGSSGGPLAAARKSEVRLNRYLTLDHQKWSISRAAGAYYKIVNVSTGEALQSQAGPGSSRQQPVELAAFTGADAQLWQLDQLTDASYLIRNKQTNLCLAVTDSAGGSRSIITSVFTPGDLHQWTITTP